MSVGRRERWQDEPALTASVATPAGAAEHARPDRRRSVVSLGRLWRWHDEPTLIAWVATPAGKAAVWLAALLLIPGAWRFPVALTLAPALAWPERRIDLLALAAVGVLLAKLPFPTYPAGLALRGATALVVLGILLVAYQAARRFRDLPALVRRFPIAAVHVALLGTVGATMALRHAFGIAEESALGIPLIALQTVLPFLLWRVSYLMLAGRRGTVAKDRFRDHFFYLFPLWGGTQTPYGKGHGYLMQRKATASADLAAAELAGIKLLALAWVWTAVNLVFEAAVHGDPTPGLGWLAAHGPAVPRLGQAVGAGPASYGLAARWGAVAAGLVGNVLDLSIAGHAVIGVLRLFGFRVFRNTYKPLLATSVVEFWNRYFYYFKELMVEFFFYPTYIATARFSQRVRIFLAITAAAAVGNLYYHVLRDFSQYVVAGANSGWSQLAGRITYSLFLAVGIYVSMIREQSRRGRKAPAGGSAALRRLRAIAGVWIFFGLLHVWSVGSTRYGFGERLRFSLGLVGITGTHAASHE
jgi:hypothetical protein